MATELFKDGESILVEPSRIQAHIEQGWSPEDPNRPTPRIEVHYPPGMDIENMSEDEAHTAILKEMGIEVKNPEPVKPKRRGRPRKAK